MITDQPPLIVHVVHRFDTGGLENGLVNLINGLPDDSFRHVIVALTEYTDFRLRLQKPVECIALHKVEGGSLGLYPKLYRLFRELKPQIVHTRNLATLEAQLPAFLAGVQYRIHSIHGWDMHDLGGTNNKYRWLNKVFSLFVHRYVALSKDLENYLVDKVGIKQQRVERICNGVDIDKFAPKEPGSDPLQQELLPDGFLPEGAIVVGAVGRMEAVKDHENLADAFIQLMAEYPPLKDKVRLVIVGEGSRKVVVEQKLVGAGLSGLCYLAGQQNNISEWLNSFDVFVLPSKAEGISNTILEAMACGLPVVATDVGGNSELVADQVCGQLVPSENPTALANAIYTYVSDTNRITSHGQHALERARALFSIDKMVEDYHQLYRVGI